MASTHAYWKAATKVGQRQACPLSPKLELERIAPRRPSIWVTRRRPKIDRIACPWLIRRFLDPQARILFVDPDQVNNVARESGGVPFDIKDVELSHDRRTLLVRYNASSCSGWRANRLAGAARLDRAGRRYGAARSSPRKPPACMPFRWACRRSQAMTITDCSSAVSSSTMPSSRGCALPPKSDTTGRPKPHDGNVGDH